MRRCERRPVPDHEQVRGGALGDLAAVVAQVAFPLPFVRANKVWPSVGRVDNPYGDRNLMCSCPPVEAFAE